MRQASERPKTSGVAKPLRCLLISDFTIEPFAEALRTLGTGPEVHPEVLPYGQVTQSLFRVASNPELGADACVIVWTRPEGATESFRALLEHEPVAIDQLMGEVDAFIDHVLAAAASASVVLVPTWVLSPSYRGLGPLSLRGESGARAALLRMNLRLADRFHDARNVFLLDAERWVASVGKRAMSPKLWFMGKIAFAPEVFDEAAADVKAALHATAGRTAKAVIVDLDDTLWGGIVGEVGWQGLRLGGHDAVGESFVDFQRQLKALSRAGVILGIVSKNDEATALEAIDKHPEMILRRSDFAGWRINWNDKAANVEDLVADLNIGLDSVVFIDDSATERARVRESLRDILVPDWPSDKLLYSRALHDLRCFDRVTLTNEDLARTKMYVVDRERQASRTAHASLESWLASLDVRIEVDTVNGATLARATQLLNKTNQLNLATRRMDETQLTSLSARPDCSVFTFTVRDRFGEYGLTGVGSVRWMGPDAEITDYLLSCRVMGRGVEETMLHVLVARAREEGASRVTATYRPTARNRPCLEFFETKSKLIRATDVSPTFVWEADRPYPLPVHVQLLRADERAESPTP